MFGLGEILGGIGGIAGLFGADGENRRRNDLENRSLSLQEEGMKEQKRFNDINYKSLSELFNLALGFNPEKEGKATAQMAKMAFEKNLREAMQGQQSQMGGGSLSSEGAVRELDALQGASGPLQTALLEAMSNPTAKRAAMFQGVLGSAPSGGMSDAWFKAAGNMGALAQGHQGDYGGSMGLLGSSLGSLFEQDKKKRQGSGVNTPRGSLSNLG